MLRRNLLVAGALAVPLGGTTWSLSRSAAADDDWDPNLTDFDKVLGDHDAPLTMIEFASMTCGHCAAFHTETFPAIKEKYVDTGMMRYIFRDFPLDGVALRASMLARCVADDQFFSMIDVLFDNQQQWIGDDDPIAALRRIGMLAGLGADEFDECMNDSALADRVIEQRMEGERAYNITGTPTFVINGRVISGNQSLEQFDQVIDELSEST